MAVVMCAVTGNRNAVAVHWVQVLWKPLIWKRQSERRSGLSLGWGVFSFLLLSHVAAAALTAAHAWSNVPAAGLLIEVSKVNRIVKCCVVPGLKQLIVL